MTIQTTDSIVDSATSSVSNYREAQAPVSALKAALRARDAEIATTVTQIATSKGLSGAEAQRIVASLGLRSPEAHRDTGNIDAIKAAMGEISKSVADLQSTVNAL